MAIQTQKDQITALDHQEKLSRPPMYQVVMLNDDFTPMDFVVSVLMRVFHKSAPEAERIMLKIHYEGRGICGVYPHDVAETRVELVHQLARSSEHPLKCVMEPIFLDQD